MSKIHGSFSKKHIIVGEITQFPSTKVATVAVATFLMPEIIFSGEEIVATVMVATFLMSQKIATVTVASFLVSKLPATAAVATFFST
jgi:hypothetical protein